MKLGIPLAALAILFPGLVHATGTPLTVYTVYDSSSCSGKVVQNNYVVASGGSCFENTTCGVLSYASSNGYVTGCCTSDSASTLAYTKKKTDVDTVTWMIYADMSCTSFEVTSDSQMTTSLETARCNPQTDGTSKKFTFSSSKVVTSSHYTEANCTGTTTNSTIAAAEMGSCIKIGSIGLIAYATIDGATYGVTSSAGVTLTPALGALSVMVALLNWLPFE